MRRSISHLSRMESDNEYWTCMRNVIRLEAVYISYTNEMSTSPLPQELTCKRWEGKLIKAKKYGKPLLTKVIRIVINLLYY